MLWKRMKQISLFNASKRRVLYTDKKGILDISVVNHPVPPAIHGVAIFDGQKFTDVP
ncbi:hypothetical protein ABEY41_19790 [Peribacillus butanolivorans]|uniref:hypothetical protein n=1 Tax=Peribacillus TaxID=2675229 RepID=UPI0019148563|nr:hypothetical protein [Peribacillus sp. TH24]MBK5443252.1 hypothetical protein [Peribacillus sp. TH24]